MSVKRFKKWAGFLPNAQQKKFGKKIARYFYRFPYRHSFIGDPDSCKEPNATSRLFLILSYPWNSSWGWIGELETTFHPPKCHSGWMPQSESKMWVRRRRACYLPMVKCKLFVISVLCDFWCINLHTRNFVIVRCSECYASLWNMMSGFFDEVLRKSKALWRTWSYRRVLCEMCGRWET